MEKPRKNISISAEIGKFTYLHEKSSLNLFNNEKLNLFPSELGSKSPNVLKN